MAPPAGEQRRVVLHFSVPYLTHWGQSVLVYGASAALGGWDAKRGQPLTCRHEGEALVWEARVHVPAHHEARPAPRAGRREPELRRRTRVLALPWLGRAALPPHSAARGPQVVYKYAVVGEAGAVEAEDGEPRRLALPAQLEDGDVVALFDAWQARGPSARAGAGAALGASHTSPAIGPGSLEME